MERRLLGWALAYAARGFSVFPLVPGGKTPLTGHGFKDATTERALIAAWWSFNPQANIGLATGSGSGLVVLDVDGPDGESSLERFPPLPDTWCALTRRGAHWYFRHPGREIRNSAGKLGPGLDVRGDGGYVVAPPSAHADGEYEWAGEHRKLAPWPDWLNPPRNEPLRAAESARAHPAGVLHRGGRVAAVALERELAAVLAAPVGTRNDTLNRAAFALARFVSSGELRGADTARELLAAAAAAGLPEHEARRTIASAFVARRSA